MDPFDDAIAVERAAGCPVGANPGLWESTLKWFGPGSATVSVALNAMAKELEFNGSKCTQQLSFNCEMLTGVRKGDKVQIAVERTREGGRFSFLRATMLNLGQPPKGGKDKKDSATANKPPAIIATLSAVFCSPERTPKSPPFPAAPVRVSPPKFEDCVSLQELTKKYRKVNPVVAESWDWKVTKQFAEDYRTMEAAGEAQGLDAEGMRTRISEWTANLPDGIGFYFYHKSGRLIDPFSLLLFSDIISPMGFLQNNVGNLHVKDGFPFLTLSFTVNFMGDLKTTEGLRGTWARVKYKGDFSDMEEREVVMRNELGRPICVGRQNAIWRRPLKRGEKL